MIIIIANALKKACQFYLNGLGYTASVSMDFQQLFMKKIGVKIFSIKTFHSISFILEEAEHSYKYKPAQGSFRLKIKTDVDLIFL